MGQHHHCRSADPDWAEELNIALLSPEQVDAAWPYIAEMVVDGIEKNDVDASAGDFWTSSRSGQFYMILAHDDKPVAASFWRFETWPSGPVFNNLLTIGEHHRKEEWFPEMEAFVNSIVKANGVRKYVWRGPRAWGRMLPQAKSTTCNFIMEVRADE